MTLQEKIDRLSYLCRETKGATFSLNYLKTEGKWRVTFTNAMVSSQDRLKEKGFEEAIDDAIIWLTDIRKPLEVVEERFTLFN